MNNINLVQETIDDFFSRDEQTLKSIFNQLCLYIYSQESKDTDLYYLAKIFPEEYLNLLIEYYDGDSIKVPTKKNFIKCYLLACCFFLKEELNWDWNKIKNYLNLSSFEDDFSTISIGKKISSIKESLNEDLLYLIKNVEIKDIEKHLKDIKKWKLGN